MENEFTKSDITWTKDADLCCSINKVEPMDRLMEVQDVWILGLLIYQNSQRKELNVFEEKSGIIKFYLILDMTNDNVDDLFVDNNIPKHPLEAQEYSSIGCAQCTIKGQGRAGTVLVKQSVVFIYNGIIFKLKYKSRGRQI